MYRRNSFGKPLVSIGVPTYNSNHKVIRLITSILQQDYPNLEIVVSDNCSQDNTEETLASVSQTDRRIRYFRQETNIGMMPNFDFVMRKAKGKYFMWVADDDQLESGILSKYVTFMEDNSEYSLISGQIKYWSGDRLVHIEKDFTSASNSRIMRVLSYYWKVVYGGMFHGLYRYTSLSQTLMRNLLGIDWHIVAEMAFMGKIKNLNEPGYHKQLGGTSKDFKSYAKRINISTFAGQFPFIRISLDAFREIISRSPIYRALPVLSRLMLACGASFNILANHYLRVYPLILGGKIKRVFKPKKVMWKNT